MIQNSIVRPCQPWNQTIGLGLMRVAARCLIWPVVISLLLTEAVWARFQTTVEPWVPSVQVPSSRAIDGLDAAAPSSRSTVGRSPTAPRQAAYPGDSWQSPTDPTLAGPTSMGPTQVRQNTLGQNSLGPTSTDQAITWEQPVEQSLGPNQPLPGRLADYSDEEIVSEPLPPPQVVFDFYHESYSPYRNYRSDESYFGFVSSGDTELGWTDLGSNFYSKRGKQGDLNLGIAHHWLSGPQTPDLPARVHDLVVGYQRRRTIAERFSYDLATSVGVYSDFEGSARQGVRFVSHAVGIWHANESLDFVFGVDYLDRDDIKILPVIGWSWHDPTLAPVRFDLVFPRPRIEWILDVQYRLYISGQLGGGTWDIEFPDESDDVMTYRDYRVLFGLESLGSDGDHHALEFGYVFQRQLELHDRSFRDEYGDSFVIQLTTRR